MKGLASRCIGAIDIQESVNFYKSVFGFEPLGNAEEISGSELDVIVGSSNSRALVQLIKNNDDDRIKLIQFVSPGFSEVPKVRTIGHYGLTHLAFFVDDLDAVRNKVISANGKPLDHTRVPMIHDWYGMYITDPNGTRIEVVAGPGVVPGFSHSGICVKDLEKSINFYREFGFEPAESYDMREVHDWMGKLNEIEGITLFAQMIKDPQQRKLQLLDIVTPELPDKSILKPFNKPGFVGIEVFANNQMTDEIIRDPNGVHVQISR